MTSLFQEVPPQHVESFSFLIADSKELNTLGVVPVIYQDFDPSIKSKVLHMIKYFHENKEQLQRYEAIRSSSLAVIFPYVWHS